ncbi:MAG TPA: flagellar motor switch protein FliG, partial [Oceanipulchritudo sp.]|nr:flagellar motor switch protein FliG [Oceanipulchritudo sp.]
EQYDNIPKLRRIAMFLVMIGPDNASKILKSFDDLEIEAISREMVEIELIDDGIQQAVLKEFSGLLLESAGSVRGGYEVALEVLEKTKGTYAARNIVGKMAPTKDSKEVIDEIGEMEARQIANLIKGEQPQTISFLLGSMEEHKAAELIQLLPPDIRSEVVLRMGNLEPTPGTILNKVVKNLSRHLDNRGHQTMTHFGGANRVAKILNLVDKSISKVLLTELEENDSSLGAQVRQKMFSFNDLIRVSVPDMQRIMREIDTSTLVLAMKPAPEILKEKIYSSLSKRAAEGLRDELDMLGSVRLKEVEAAQESIIGVVRQLEEDGEVSLGGEDNAFV